ncbi:uncharacterized protein LOC127751379 [Frankliniella occidentalis]|uniref:DNA-directed DNA polymerase n=1 Tax=Frankliniella occidentalis TaxID=133901 RepID=A0A9C6X7Y2_FRAOC|nr:uncharacterized protein LOC127751379 [Frankliniella occidentalis]
MSRWSEKEKKKDYKYITIYWDTECTTHTPVEGKAETFEHIPNLIVSQAVCDECANVEQNEYFCTVCKTRQQIFHNLDDPSINVMGQFIDYLRSFPAKTQLLIVAHNARSYDGPLLLQELTARKIKVDSTQQGAKISALKAGNWKFIDSLMFLAMPLSAMPNSFALNELKKGYWPHLANKPEYYKYEGPMLEKSLYCITEMKTKAAKEFTEWYDEQVAANYVFNFRRDFLEYCISDVTVLRRAATAFRKLFCEVAGFDPMFNCVTLSSACMSAFRRNFLKAETIGIVPPGGYHGRGKQSHIALQWLDYETHVLGRKITTMYTDREVKVMGRQVDGYVELPLPDGGVEQRIYQFHGCYWHNCPIHFPPTSDSEENRYEKTQQITALFREAGYKVIEMWECEFKRLLKHDPDVTQYFTAHPFTRVTPLNLRDGLAGGRTSALRSYHKIDPKKGEKIMMVDVVSEYPNANLRAVYPVGHPTIHLEGSLDIPPPELWNGMIKCTVLPPQNLFLPVLWYKYNGKLLFPLCRTCAETESTEICHHEPHQRELLGSWCAPELHLALEKGYELLKVHEVYQYPGTSQFNPETQEDGVLSAYVRCFMALKIQASGWPANCKSEEEKQKYVEDTLKFDGVVLDPTKMEKNPALRTLAKLMCNSFWGKFGEKTLRPKTHLIYNYGQLMKLLTNPSIEITSIIPLGEECMQVTCMPVEDSEESLPTSSLIHAAFTTCHGRLQLYQYMEIVGQRALYTDTDSLCYISCPDELDPPTGTHLGDLTDQIEEDYGPSSYIVEYVGGSPKNYSYAVAVGGDTSNIKYCIKVRGISINSSCDQIVTFENLKAMVLGNKEKTIVPIPRQIARLTNWKIVTRASKKQWQAKNTKRRRVGLEMTVPLGYNAWTMADKEDQDLLEVMEVLDGA